MNLQEQLYYSFFEIDRIRFQVFASHTGIKEILLNKKKFHPLSSIMLQPDDPYLFNIFRQLHEYFLLKRKEFDIPIDISGSEFQMKVWKHLKEIPFGKTVSYKFLAEKVGGETFVRAVGRANATNPVPILIPCHRVINANGKLGGYGGGIKLKEKLLEMEGCLSLELFERPL